MRIALDMDSTIAEATTIHADIILKLYGKTFTKSEVTSWNWIQEHFGFTTGQMIESFADVWRSHWNEILPTEPNIEKKVEKLASLADVTVVTSASPEQTEGKIRWLEKYGLKQIPILFVPYGKTKEALPYHIFVDDRDDTIEKVIMAGKIGFLYNQPWNQTCKVGMRIESLSSVISFLEGKGI